MTLRNKADEFDARCGGTPSRSAASVVTAL
jgi:hypothetical protein